MSRICFLFVLFLQRNTAQDQSLQHQGLLIARAIDIRFLRERTVVGLTSKSDDMIDPLGIQKNSFTKKKGNNILVVK